MEKSMLKKTFRKKLIFGIVLAVIYRDGKKSFLCYNHKNESFSWNVRWR